MDARTEPSRGASPDDGSSPAPPGRGPLYVAGLCLGALGVVYGDIGTSPLYALRECFHGPWAVAPTQANVLGVLSLILWTLIVVISVKYLLIVLRADNHGEGGILALMALIRPEETTPPGPASGPQNPGPAPGAAPKADPPAATPATPERASDPPAPPPPAEPAPPRGGPAPAAPESAPDSTPFFGTRSPLVLLALVGAALLYGDGMITPAISVLSAIEGLHVATPLFDPYVRPITVAVLLLLFSLQHKGTAKVGAMFGPVTLLWFTTLGILGVTGILAEPTVLRAVDPWHAIDFFLRNQHRAFLVLGAVFLVTTGGEALYADMGHFGRLPIRVAWYTVVLPGLTLNYFGQGALLLANPDAAQNPFYRLAPDWALYPLVGLATLATVIASQAVISGCFSLTRQAVQLGYCPRLKIDHTSEREIGQIYIGPINWALMLASIGLVLFFGSSGNLAAAYGLAVSTTMVVTTILLFVVAKDRWGWGLVPALLMTGGLGLIDSAFFAANLAKLLHGGWFAIAVATGAFLMMTTWRRGRTILLREMQKRQMAVDTFVESIRLDPPHRVPRTAVFMTASSEGIPHSLLHNLKHNRVLHKPVVLLTVSTKEVPKVPDEHRVRTMELDRPLGLYRLIADYGFMESPNVRELLEERQHIPGVSFDAQRTTYFLGVETLVPRKSPAPALPAQGRSAWRFALGRRAPHGDPPRMPEWQRRLFALMARNAQRPTDFFGLPPNQVVEIGSQIQL